MPRSPIMAGTILFVDDEVNVLGALERVFFQEAGLECMQNTDVDVVVSDQKMPDINGAGFLKQVRKLSPEARRIMLTGYRDHADTVDAINQGGIHQYLNEPWDDNVMRSVVLGELEQRLLEAADGLAGEEIPIGADFPAAVQIVSQFSGTVLDPGVVATLETMLPEKNG